MNSLPLALINIHMDGQVVREDGDVDRAMVALGGVLPVADAAHQYDSEQCRKPPIENPVLR